MRPRPLSDFAAAVGFLTLVPVGRIWPDGVTPRSTGWYPWVGWMLGGAAAAGSAAWIAAMGKPGLTGALLGAAAVVGGWALLTRFLHWDGLADAADGLWGGSTPERRLEIMRDSRIGSFGAAAMLFAGVTQVAAVADLLAKGSVWPLVAAPVLGRLAAALAAWELPAARTDGLGLTAVRPAGVYERSVAACALLALLTFTALGVPVRSLLICTAGGLFAGIVVPRGLSRPVGGMTGDLFGATVLLVETFVLVTGAMLS